ncbi:MAG: hypothetical protein U1E10_14745, partial [Bdellovibrionales bacterium]|nr:hypothetical protein [Bdellovibrionales bacterium]
TMKTDLPGTIKSLVQLLESYPQNVVLVRSIVTLSRKNGDEKMALEYIERGLRLKPNCIFLLMDLANQKIKSGDLAGALNIAEQIEMGLSTSEDEERYNKSTIAAIRGLVCFHQGKKAEALKLLVEADDLSFLVSLSFEDFKKTLNSLRE